MRKKHLETFMAPRPSAVMSLVVFPITGASTMLAYKLSAATIWWWAFPVAVACLCMAVAALVVLPLEQDHQRWQRHDRDTQNLLSTITRLSLDPNRT